MSTSAIVLWSYQYKLVYNLYTMSLELQKIIQIIQENKAELIKLQKDTSDLKNILHNLETKIDAVESKIQDFEIVFDAAEILEERQEEEENKYNTEWNPYDDEDFQVEDYENYDDDDDDGY